MKSLLILLVVLCGMPSVSKAVANFSAQAANPHWSYVTQLDSNFQEPQELMPVNQYTLMQENGGFRFPANGFGLEGITDRSTWSQYHQGLTAEEGEFHFNGKAQPIVTPVATKQPIRLQAGNLIAQVLSITPSKGVSRNVASTAPIAKTSKYRGDNNHEVLTVQISSYLTQKEADARVQQLKSKGLDAFTTTAKVNGATHYRVCAGHYEHFEDARFAKVQLAHRMHIKDAFIHTATDDLNDVSSQRMITSDQGE